MIKQSMGKTIQDTGLKSQITRRCLIKTKLGVIARNDQPAGEAGVTKQSQISSDEIASTASRSRNDDKNDIYEMGSKIPVRMPFIRT